MSADVAQAPRAMCFTAYTDNVRAIAIVDGLERAGWDVRASSGLGPRSTPLELALTLLPNCWMALRTKADLAVGCKPHVNVTLPLLLCKLRGIPTWLDVDDRDHAYRTGFSSRVVWASQRAFPKHFDVVSYHHPKLLEHLVIDLGCDPRKAVQIPQGVDPDRFACDRELGRPTAGPRVASYAAHMNRAADLDVVLKAWQLVVDRRPESLLMVVGGGQRLRHFRRQATYLGLGRSVVFSGSVRRSEVPAYLAAADVALLYASDRLVNQYRCSLKLREYFAAGLPVVCNDFGELADFADVTYQSDSSIEGFASMALRVLDGHDDGRQLRARELTYRDMAWEHILGGAQRQVLRRLGCCSPGAGRPDQLESQANPGTIKRPGNTKGRERPLHRP